jgi:RNA polymerase sigma factor (sigma-70 family)
LAGNIPNRKVSSVAQPDSALEPQQSAAKVAPGEFEAFYRVSYQEVVKAAMTAGATIDEAADAASRTYIAMLERWPVPGPPLLYARRAVVHNFIKDKTRGTRRVAQRLFDRGPELHQEGAADPRLTDLEGLDWVKDALAELSPAQREVMERIACGLTHEEIARDLGKSQEVVRRRLCDARARLVRVINPDGSRVDHPPREESP